MPLPSTFCSSDLVRLLGGWSAPAPDDPGVDFAERLSLQLGPLAAIDLQAATQQVRSGRFTARRTPATLARQLHADVERVRQALARAIAQPVEPFVEVQLPGRKGERPQLPSPAEAIGVGYQRRHAALQKQMEQMVAASRDHVRQALSRCSSRLQRLALLDATMEKVLAPREQAALPRIARQLELRFRQLRKQHDDGDDAWLQAYAAEWRQVLLAERDLRLHPVAGLVEAVAEETNEDP